MRVDSAFKALIDSGDVIWIRNYQGEFYFNQPYTAYGSRFVCRPGEGYDLNMTSMDTVEFHYSQSFTPDNIDEGEEEQRGYTRGIESVTQSHFLFRDCTQDLYPVVVETLIVQGIEIEEGDELAVFTSDSICCGAHILDEGQTGFIITAWENDIMTQEKDGFDWGDEMFFKYYDASTETELVMPGGFTIASAEDDPIGPRHGYLGQGQYAVRSLHFDASSIQIPKFYALHQNYPNPFNPVTRIRFDLPYLSKVKLEVFNILVFCPINT